MSNPSKPWRAGEFRSSVLSFNFRKAVNRSFSSEENFWFANSRFSILFPWKFSVLKFSFEMNYQEVRTNYFVSCCRKCCRNLNIFFKNSNLDLLRCRTEPASDAFPTGEKTFSEQTQSNKPSIAFERRKGLNLKILPEIKLLVFKVMCFQRLDRKEKRHVTGPPDHNLVL